jgi:hypothetical protein
MARRVAAALVIAAAVLLVTTGCGNDSADPPPLPTVTFSFGDRTTPAGPTTPPSVPSGLPADQTSSPSPNPWPTDLTPAQVTAAQAALAAYPRYWSVMDSIAGNPGADAAAQVADVATAEAGDDMLTAAQDLAAAGQHSVGGTAVDPRVTGVAGGVVTLTACVDTSAADVVDGSGVSVRPPDAPGSYRRYVTTAQVAVFNGGQWLVAVDDADRSTTC